MSLPVRLCQQEWISASRIDTVSLQFHFSPTTHETRSEENPEQQKYSFSLLTIRRRGTWALIWWTGTTHVPPFRSRSFEFLWLSPATNKKKKKKLIIETFPRQHNSMGITYPAHDHQLLERACQHQFYSEKTKKKTKRKQKKGSTSKYMAVLGLRAPPCW